MKDVVAVASHEIGLANDYGTAAERCTERWERVKGRDEGSSIVPSIRVFVE